LLKLVEVRLAHASDGGLQTCPIGEWSVSSAKGINSVGQLDHELAGVASAPSASSTILSPSADTIGWCGGYNSRAFWRVHFLAAKCSSGVNISKYTS